MNITVDTTITVENGPQWSPSRTLVVSAYDLFTIEVAAQAAGTPPVPTSEQVNVVPAGTALTSFIIMASRYDPGLSYAVGTNEFELDQPVFLLGSSVVAYLGGDPTTITLKNATATAVTITLLVGRS